MKRLIIILGSFVLIALLAGYIRAVIRDTVGQWEPGTKYIVSFGDSVAAGAGLNPDTNRRSPGCDISELASPYLLGKFLHQPVQQFACSGATIGSADQSKANTVYEQYKLAEKYIHGNDVVITAGANDIGWLQTLASCATSNCATNVTAQELSTKTAKMQANLTSLLKRVKQQQPHRIVVNTYYDLIRPGDTCLTNVGITVDETNFIHAQEALLNSAITKAATTAGAKVVAVDFSGHLLCDQNPWIQGISDRAPLHPTAAGQQQIANQDSKLLQD